MKLSNRAGTSASVLAAALVISAPASAVNLRTVVAPIYQMGGSARAQIGHTVIASTDYNRLYAGGTYKAACGAPGAVPIEGQRFLSAENIVGGVSLTVTVPQWHPAIVSMPGYYEASRGQTLSCVYNWTSRAVESGYSISAGGISIQTGYGERNDGGSQPFTMTVPSRGDPNEGSTCIP